MIDLLRSKRRGNLARHYRWVLLIATTMLGCARDLGSPVPPPPPSPPPPPGVDVRLTDMVIANLPSPFYRFEYDGMGNVAFVDYASGLQQYEILYQGGRISAMQALGPFGDRLTYFYDEAGKTRLVTYSDAADSVFVRISLAFEGERLILLERERLIEGSFRLDKRMSFRYHADGNLAELTDQRLPVGDQTAATFIDRFEQYDAGINVDGFSLIHNEFFDHLVLLPDVRLQRTNPAAVTRTGSGDNYHVDYTYTYDDANRPLTKRGDVLFLSGPNAGRRFGTSTTFAYE